MMTSDEQQPRKTRFVAGFPARVEIDGNLYECRADNVSRAGALLAGSLPPAKGTEVVVTLESVGGDLSVTYRAHVMRHSVDSETGETMLGLEFLKPERGDTETLEALIQRAMEGGTPTWKLDDLPDNATTAQIHAALDAVPLPHRIQLAARGLPRERAMLIKDSHLQVLDALARNPNLLLHELMSLLRLPSLLPHTLDAISKDSRWSGNEQVRVMLVSHRNTSHPVATRVLGTMRDASLQKVLRTPGLKPGIHALVMKRLSPGRRLS